MFRRFSIVSVSIRLRHESVIDLFTVVSISRACIWSRRLRNEFVFSAIAVETLVSSRSWFAIRALSSPISFSYSAMLLFVSSACAFILSSGLFDLW